MQKVPVYFIPKLKLDAALSAYRKVNDTILFFFLPGSNNYSAKREPSA
jgi:hypothetical protein